jgi:hypothetical protein
MTATIHQLHLASKLKVQGATVKQLLDERKTRLIGVRGTLADLHSSESSPTYITPVPFRGDGGAISAVMGH